MIFKRKNLHEILKNTSKCNIQKKSTIWFFCYWRINTSRFIKPPPPNGPTTKKKYLWWLPLNGPLLIHSFKRCNHIHTIQTISNSKQKLYGFLSYITYFKITFLILFLSTLKFLIRSRTAWFLTKLSIAKINYVFKSEDSSHSHNAASNIRRNEETIK